MDFAPADEPTITSYSINGVFKSPIIRPAGEAGRRAIGDIPLSELAAIVLDNPDLLDEPDPARDLARLLGAERLAAVSRTRLDEAIARACQHVAKIQPTG